MSQTLAEWQARAVEGVRRNGNVDDLFAGPLGDRFAVYSGGYETVVGGSLREDFPLTERLLGAARFEAALGAFLVRERDAWELELGEVSPAFAAALGVGAPAALRRALALDLAAVSARRAPDPEAQSGFGLHSSARFYRDGRRGYVLWRGEGGVCRERIDTRTEKLLAAFREPAALEVMGTRLEALGEEADYVQKAVAAWTEAGLICFYSP